MLGGCLIIPVDEITFGYSFRATSAFLEVEDGLLDVEHVSQGFVHHSQVIESFGSRQVRGVVAYHWHQQGIRSALIELEHTVGQLAGHAQGQVDTLRTEGSFYLLALGSFDDFRPSFFSHQFVLFQKFVHLTVIAISNGHASCGDDRCL